jgi:predicted PurR-regulated permease PerM
MAEQKNGSTSFFLTAKGRHVLVISIGVIVLLVLFYRLQHIINPLLISFLIAYILDPFVDWFENKKVPRLLIVITVYLLLLAAIIPLVLYVFPEIFNQAVDLVQWVSHKYKDLRTLLQQRYPARYDRLISWTERSISSVSSRVAQILLANLNEILGSAFTIVTLIFLIPLYTFFFLWRFDYLTSVIAKYLPRTYKKRIISVIHDINQVVGNFFRGRLIICLIVGVSSAIGFQIAGIPFAWPLGLLIGMFNFVPYLAPIFGLPPVLLIAYLTFQDFRHPLYALIVYGVTQLVDNWILTPFIQGKMVGLHPITTIVVVLIGADLAGVFGLILAIPAAAAIKILFKNFIWPHIAEAADLDINLQTPKK